MRILATIAVLALLASALAPSGLSDEGKAAPRAGQRCVLFELFSNVNNTNCADDENATARLSQDYARSRLAILEWFQAGDPLACPQSQERYLYYASINPPKAFMDGSDVSSGTNNETQTYEAYKSAFATEMNRTPSASITGKATLSGSNGTVNTTISFSELTSGLPSGLAAYCFIYEDGVHYAGSSNISYHKYVVRRQAGKLSLTSPIYRAGDNVTANFSFTVQPGWNVASMGAVVVIQSDLSIGKTVHQSALFSLGAGATYGVELAPRDQSIDMFAGRTSDLTVQAKNTGTATDKADFSVTGPAASWGSLSKATADLSPGEQTSVTVSIMVPAGTAAGGYLLKVRAVSRADPAKTAESNININVKEELVYGVALSPATASQDVMAGDSATFQIRVKNTGTLSDTVDLTVQGTPAEWASLDRAAVGLPANGEDTVTLTVSVASDAQTGRFDFTVKGTSRADATKSATAQATVKITGQSAASFGVDITPKLMTRGMAPGGSASITLGVNNTGTATDTYDLSKAGDASGWAVLQPISLEVFAGSVGQIAVDVGVPSSTPTGQYTLTVRATSRGDSSKRSEASITFSVQLPEEAPRITSVSGTPLDPTSKDVVTITAVVTGSSVDRVELSYIEGSTVHPAQRMQKSGNSYSIQIGPFKAKTVVKYNVTAISASGLRSVSGQQSFTAKAAPQGAQQTPGFTGLTIILAFALAALAISMARRRL